jgi:hypothetical protein
MHMLIVLAAFAIAAVTPYINAPAPSDAAQMTDDAGDIAPSDDEREV